jgi:hypothetical protein
MMGLESAFAESNGQTRLSGATVTYGNDLGNVVPCLRHERELNVGCGKIPRVVIWSVMRTEDQQCAARCLETGRFGKGESSEVEQSGVAADTRDFVLEAELDQADMKF